VKRANRGFTLLELLTTMSIMGFLGVAAASGYQALVRGMNERGVTAVAASALRTAKERALVDRRHIAVFCYNRLVRAPNLAADENGMAVGVITAVRRMGRLSGVTGNFLYDEFADLDQTYETDEESELAKRKGFRLFKFNNGTVQRMEYSLVADATYLDEDTQLYLPSEGQTTNAYMAAFYKLDASDHEPSAWKAGDGYGFEFLEVQLPDGFVFDGDVPSQVGNIEVVKVIDFDPEKNQNESVVIWAAKPNASGMPTKAWKVGEAKSDDSGV